MFQLILILLHTKQQTEFVPKYKHYNTIEK